MTKFIEGWNLVPAIGTRVTADHPVTCLNPSDFFEVSEIKVDGQGNIAVRGTDTMWFGLSGLSVPELPVQLRWDYLDDAATIELMNWASTGHVPVHTLTQVIAFQKKIADLVNSSQALRSPPLSVLDRLGIAYLKAKDELRHSEAEAISKVVDILTVNPNILTYL